MSEHPAWYKFARHRYQQVYEWLLKREPQAAEWWDGTFYALWDKFSWPGEHEADIVLELSNKDGAKRSIAYNLTEIVHESAPDKN